MDPLPDITIEAIPRDVLLIMLKNLENDDYETLAHVCIADKYFNERVCNDNYWYSALYRKFSMSREYVDLIRGNNSLPALFIYMSRPYVGPNNQAFKTPILISDELRDFFRHGNFGLSDPNDPYSLPLNEVLMVGQNGISAHSILTNLMLIYVKINRAVGIDVTATPDMIKYLPRTFEKFPVNFRIPMLTSIIFFNIIKKADLTPIQTRILVSEGVNDILTKDDQLVLKLKRYYRNRGWF